MAMPTHMLMLDDFMLLGWPICHLIITTQAAIRNHHLLVAYNPLKLPHIETSCKKSMVSTCQCNWEAAWWDGLSRLYLHPEFPASPQDILLKLESTPIVGVTTACRLEAIDGIKQQRVFEREDDYKEAVLRKIKQLEGTVITSI
jgi:hypothetical protein